MYKMTENQLILPDDFFLPFGGQYKRRLGHYPEAILADQIYRTREDRKFCKEKGIRLSGPALGRPSKDKEKTQDRLAKQDAGERNAIEGKFGEGKRHYGMGLFQHAFNRPARRSSPCSCW